VLKRETSEIYGGMEVKLQGFLIFVLDRAEWSVRASTVFLPALLDADLAGPPKPSIIIKINLLESEVYRNDISKYSSYFTKNGSLLLQSINAV
jgi:hypothetical protein